jgi:hypothetical protein
VISRAKLPAAAAVSPPDADVLQIRARAADAILGAAPSKKAEAASARRVRALVEHLLSHGQHAALPACLFGFAWRIWRREGLNVPHKQPKRGRLWLNDGSCVRLRAERPNHVWSYDFVEDRTHDGRKFRMLCVIDEFTREAHTGLCSVR